MVVDDSAVVRQFFSDVLSQEPGMRVTVASDPVIAMRKMKRIRPDVILLDLEMPRMDGLTFLKKIMAEDPIPVVVCSGHAARGTQAALRALEEGAVEVLGKPKVGVRDFLHESAVLLSDTVRAAAEARVARRGGSVPARPRLTADAVLPPGSFPWRQTGAEKVVAIGASTGGTQALRQLLSSMPDDGPGMVVVQHMPEGFTGAFSRRLDECCGIEVREAADGDRIVQGQALIAPGNRHVTVVRRGPSYGVTLRDGPLVSRHRPSVDVLFRSVSQVAGPDAVGVILTGMGSDGAQGLLEVKRAGGSTIAQDEETCVVFGMPKEAIEQGGVEQVVPLSKVGKAILDEVGRRSALSAESRGRKGR
jgi:two-component system chemotaxis response regulator CheB